MTYVDTDRRAARYFADEVRVAAELRGRARPGAGTDITFLQLDYTRTAFAYLFQAVEVTTNQTVGP